MNKIEIKEPIEYIRKLKKYIGKNEILAVITTIIVGMLTNFNFIITEALQPDALSIVNWNIASEWEISLGRYGIRYINLLRFGLVNKFLIVFISLCFLAISMIFIIKTFKIKNKLLIVLLSAIIAAAPQVAETFFFIYCADVYCLAFCLATVVGYLLDKYFENKKIVYLTGAMILTASVCSLYQAYLGVVLGITFTLLVRYLIENVKLKEVVLTAVKFIVTIFVGVLVYYIIFKVVLLINNIEMASYKGANSLGITTIINLPKTILQSYKDCFDFFFGNTIIYNSFWRRRKIYGFIAILSIICVAWKFIKEKYEMQPIRIICLIVLLLVFPIGINIMDIIAPDTSINLVTGPGIITLFILAIVIENYRENTSISNLMKWGQSIFLVIIIWTFVLSNTYTAMAREETYRNYYTISNDIYNKVTQLSGYSKDKNWMFSYYIEYRPSNLDRTNGFVTLNYETWNNYNGTRQNISFYKRYLGIDISICSKQDYDKIVASEEFKKMPVYPSDGSIKIINDIIVIKVSDNTF